MIRLKTAACLAAALVLCLVSCEKRITADSFEASLEISNPGKQAFLGGDLNFSVYTNHPSLSVETLAVSNLDSYSEIKVNGSPFETGKVYQASASLDADRYRTDFSVCGLSFEQTHSGFLRLTVYDAVTRMSKDLEMRYYSVVPENGGEDAN